MTFVLTLPFEIKPLEEAENLEFHLLAL